MKTIATLLITLITYSVSAQMISKDVGDFHTLKVFDLIEVNLIPSDENKVVIKGERTSEIQVINKNGKLKIRMELDNSFNGKQTFVEVYSKGIKTIDANEGAFITVNEMIEQDEIELKAHEGGRIMAGLDVQNTKVRAVTGGIIQVSGLSRNQEIVLNTGGVFEGMDLKTQRTKIGITAAGEAEVNASDVVDLRLTAGGDIKIYGNPKEINEKRLAGGRVKVMN